MWFDAVSRRQVRVEGTAARAGGERVRRVLREPRPGPPARRGRLAPVRGARRPRRARARLRRAPRHASRAATSSGPRDGAATCSPPATSSCGCSATTGCTTGSPTGASRAAGWSTDSRPEAARRVGEASRTLTSNVRRDVSSQGALPSFPAGGDDVEAPEGGGPMPTWAPSRCRVPPRLRSSSWPSPRCSPRRSACTRAFNVDRGVAPPRGAPDAQPAIARRRPAHRGDLLPLRPRVPRVVVAGHARDARVPRPRRPRVRRRPRDARHSAAARRDLHGGAGPLHACSRSSGCSCYLADLCWPLWDRRRQTVHDKLAQDRRPRPRTKVLRWGCASRPRASRTRTRRAPASATRAGCGASAAGRSTRCSS